MVYMREGGGDNTIMFEGEGTKQVDNYAQGGRFLPLKESTVVLCMAVDVDHRAGGYHMAHAWYLREQALGALELEGDGLAPPPESWKARPLCPASVRI